MKEKVYLVSDSGEIITPYGRLAKPTQRKDGYYRMAFFNNRILLHRIVCRAFHGPMDIKKSHVNHKDGDRGNNSANNLEWASIKENNQHTYKINSDIKRNQTKASLKIYGIKKDDPNKERHPFNSISEAAIQLGLSSICIGRVLGKNKSTGGWIFEKYEDPDLDGEVWKKHPQLNILLSNKERYQNFRSQKIFAGSGKVELNVNRKSYLFHRLVYEAYNNTIIPPTKQIDHLDEINKTNTPEKLECVTGSENCQRSHDRGIRVTTTTFRAIIATHRGTKEKTRFNSVKEAGEKLGINRKQISGVLIKNSKSAGGGKNKDEGYTFEYDDCNDEVKNAKNRGEWREFTKEMLEDIMLKKKS